MQVCHKQDTVSQQPLTFLAQRTVGSSGEGEEGMVSHAHAPLSQLQVCKRMPIISTAQFPMGCSPAQGWGTGVWGPLLQANLIL